MERFERQLAIYQNILWANLRVNAKLAGGEASVQVSAMFVMEHVHIVEVSSPSGGSASLTRREVSHVGRLRLLMTTVVGRTSRNASEVT